MKPLFDVIALPCGLCAICAFLHVNVKVSRALHYIDVKLLLQVDFVQMFILSLFIAQHCIVCKCLQSSLIKAHTSIRMRAVCSSAMRRACSPHIQSTSFLFPVKLAELCNDRGKDCKVVEWHAGVHTAYQQEETGTNYPSGSSQVASAPRLETHCPGARSVDPRRSRGTRMHPLLG